MTRQPPPSIQASHSRSKSTAIATNEPKPLSHVDRLQMPEVRAGLQRRLGGRMSVDEFVATVAGQIQQNPMLLRCRAMSLFGAIYEAAQLGLRPDPTLQHCYLVPFRNRKAGVTDCKLIMGYRGVILLATQGADAIVTKVEADVVYASDTFDEKRGLKRDLTHSRRRTSSRADRGEPVAVYSVVHLKGAEPTFEVIDWWEIEELRRESGRRGDSPWNTHPEAMAKKTAIRRSLKYVPLSALAARALILDEHADEGVDQQLSAPIEEIGEVVDPEPEPEPPFKPINFTIETTESRSEVNDREYVEGVDDVAP